MRKREEILENDLSDVSVGDYVFHIRVGFVEVGSTALGGSYPLLLLGGCSLTLKGRSYTGDEYPVAFRSIDHCIEYFQEIKKIEEKKNVWTWDKIQACDKIDFGASMFKRDHEMIVLDKKKFNLYYGARTGSGNKSSFEPWEGYKFYDRNGNLIDPREY